MVLYKIFLRRVKASYGDLCHPHPRARDVKPPHIPFDERMSG